MTKLGVSHRASLGAINKKQQVTSQFSPKYAEKNKTIEEHSPKIKVMASN